MLVGNNKKAITIIIEEWKMISSQDTRRGNECSGGSVFQHVNLRKLSKCN